MEVIPTVIGELERLKAVLWSRLTMPAPTNHRPHEDDEVVDDAHEVARIVRRSIMLAPRYGTRVRFRPLIRDRASPPPPVSRDP